MYFTEPGLAAWLLGIESPEQIIRDPLHGNLFENMIVVEALKYRHNEGKEPNLYFWRDNNGNEIDLLLERQFHLIQNIYLQWIDSLSIVVLIIDK